MTSAWRLLTDDGASAPGGLAMDEALLAGYARGEPERAPTLRLYTYASSCALVGRYQDARAEVDLEAARRTSTAVNRRPTGGGAIVMGAGQLGVAIADRTRAAERPRETLARFADGIVRGLAELGIDTSFRGKNDLECGGRKIAGLGLYLDGRGALLFHASVLAGLDVPFMLDVLNVPAVKLGDKAVAAVEERVTTVSRETGSAWSGAALRDVIATGYEKAFGVALEGADPDAGEIARAADLECDRYGDDAWIFQRSPRKDARGTALVKTPAGLVRVYLALDGGAIKSVLFAGDFNELPPALAGLESALRWTRLDDDRVRAVVDATFDRHPTDGLPRDLVTAAVLEAGAGAAARPDAAPERDGSCYFPEEG